MMDVELRGGPMNGYTAHIDSRATEFEVDLETGKAMYRPTKPLQLSENALPIWLYVESRR